jgi:hypothetical protein
MMQQQAQGNQLSIILQNTLCPMDNIRIPAEAEVTKLLDENFAQTLIELSKILSTETEKNEIRQMSSTIIKNMIGNVKYKEKWFQLSEEIKEAIKNNILSTLASEVQAVRKAASIAISGICKIEIPRKQWLNIFDILSNTCQNNNLYIQLSSLTALEYIYEEIQKEDIPTQTVANLLNTYYSLLTRDNPDPQLSECTLKSIEKFLPFISDFIDDKDSKIKFYNLIEKYVMNSNEKIRQAAISIFYEIAKNYYDSLNDYIENIFNFSQQIIDKDIEANKLLCIAMWYLIGEEEDYRMTEVKSIKKQSNCFLEKYYQPLSQICLKYIVTNNYESEENYLSNYSADLLFIMSRTCQYHFIQGMINYIGENINSNIEKIKYSALNVFRSIIGTVHKKNFYPIIKDSLPTISDILIQNYPTHFKNLCSLIMKKITKEYGKELLEDSSYFDKLVQLFVSLLEISTNQVKYNIILSLKNLCVKIEWSPNDQTNILSKYIEKIYNPVIKLISNIGNFDLQINIPNVGLNLLSTLVEKSALDVKDKAKDLLMLLVEMFKNTLDPKSIENKNIRDNYQQYLASSLIGFFSSGKGTPEIASNLLGFIIESMKIRNDIYEEAISLIGSMALFTKESFDPAMQLISQYLISGLRAIDSYDICKASILCFSDIINGLGRNNKYINDYLPLIMNILSNEQIDRKLKPFCFNIISDIFINCPDEGFKSFQNIMKVIGGAMQATQVSIDENNEKENIRYFIDLREHILESLSCIFSAVKDNNKTKEFIPYVQAIVNYIHIITQDYANSIEMIKEGLFLITDFCACYKKDIFPILNIELIKNMISKIENEDDLKEDENTKYGIEWAKSTIQEVLSN